MVVGLRRRRSAFCANDPVRRQPRLEAFLARIRSSGAGLRRAVAAAAQPRAHLRRTVDRRQRMVRRPEDPQTVDRRESGWMKQASPFTLATARPEYGSTACVQLYRRTDGIVALAGQRT